jgi:hypothetical protein
MGNLKSNRVGESGNVALELIVSLVLTVSFLIPSAETVYQIYRNRNEALSALNTLARTFQVSPEESLRSNVEFVRIQLQRRSQRGLQIFLDYNSNDGVIDSVNIDVGIDSNIPFKRKLLFSRTIKRASFAS